ncbi:acyl-CoA dehydrogenase family protein [Mycobacterium sp. AZCC_0083]|uniref:acyl-CoA dehydrogenase family protein n=1 Tax=Mycobacterium sp. AZCC_0083 TaxID=2735882 RepID=UPI0016091F84|nr:acyl-CoA dehydrogenase family protein [Mycobacterium sp. AZCC_0083]MBB5163915.1 alkylation response protein AidB-like acyl-CoA dehydrogenase [Mycobacterium sp. AZCC_0083]
MGLQTLTELFDKIASEAQQREQDRVLPHEQIRWLRDAGIGRLRLRTEDGGTGASLPELFGVVIDLAAADSNVAHILRAHFGFVEEHLHNPDPAARRRWLGLVAEGNIVGNAVSEQNSRAVGRKAGTTHLDTVLTPDGTGGFRLNGVKFYSTGTLFSDWVNVHAVDPDGASFRVTVPVTRAGISVEDDWDGFGQRLTGTGTTRFEGVYVQADEAQRIEARDVETPPTYFGGFYQLYLQALTAGVLAAVQSDAVALTRRRERNFSHASHPVPSEDPQVLQVVGEIASNAFAARAIVLTAAQALQEASDSATNGVFDPDAAYRAQLAAAQAKVAVDRFSYATAARLLDVGGASATQVLYGHDRHWRNIRTISTHNPTFLKATAVGSLLVNGTPPPQNGFF